MILDSGPLIAGLNAKDRHHQVAIRLLRSTSGRAVVPDPVVIEVEMTVRRWYGATMAHVFLDTIRAGAHVRMPLTDALWHRAVEIDRAYADLNLGLVDTSVMAVAEAHGEPVFTFDFRAFRGVPGPDNGAWSLVHPPVNTAAFGRACIPARGVAPRTRSLRLRALVAPCERGAVAPSVRDRIYGWEHLVVTEADLAWATGHSLLRPCRSGGCGAGTRRRRRGGAPPGNRARAHR